MCEVGLNVKESQRAFSLSSADCRHMLVENISVVDPEPHIFLYNPLIFFV